MSKVSIYLNQADLVCIMEMLLFEWFLDVLYVMTKSDDEIGVIKILFLGNFAWSYECETGKYLIDFL